ncbi:dolichyl-diphosphooligosaccharide--protein glycosyltransferase subunit 1-like [Oppia nitens]|uniref:dolichyl-diphosphooligosaccharide--protein glycosyltransferase subunit 1-like n=1 Tax=Oppia nitens TaxID=1686743 RepID=UPI0023D99AF3|nr:dolichyl-diphosphooligosaccharide--protein glycosyltransferase subunit 1-like [Oppia nitens]
MANMLLLSLLSSLALLLAFNAIVISGQTSGGQQGVVNAKVDRVIDISSQLVKIQTRVVVDNSKNQKKLDHYLVVLDDNERQQLSYISATIDKNPLKVTKIDDKTYRLELASTEAIAAGQSASATIEIESVLTHALLPFPTQIVQSDRQLVQYFGNVYFLSPYETRTQTTKVKLTPTGSIESYTKLKPTAQTDRTITYGPYENIAANSQSELKIHYENNSPFLTVTRLERNIEVSHWSAIVSVEETIDVLHTGAELKGPFSRYEFQREPTNGISSVKSWKTKLPLNAYDIYYRDEIGNISTSNLKATSKHLVADLRPRFPLFGGWKTHYVLGYYITSQNVLLNDGNDFVLKVPFIDHIFDNSIIDDVVVKVILPEGAYDINYRSAYSVDRQKDQKHYTYLDTIGRTVLVFQKSNLVEDHIQDLEVHYKFQKIFMLQEPLLIVVAIFSLCILVIIFVRLDFSISKNPQKTSKAETKVKTK